RPFSPDRPDRSLSEDQDHHRTRYDRKGKAALPKEKKMKTPEFKNLKEERTFWDTHDATDYLDDFEEAPDVVFAREKKAVLSLRLEPKISRKLREMAIQEGLQPTAYARMLIIQGLRERIVNRQGQ
ncbi:MAG: BrnA antitoxin family protein, partial [Proteobacteria bacterium]|nr:BrnA antitoxin family protein [Pseudomonadota bacterium]